MKTRCIIVDDEPIARKVIINHLQHFENIEIVAECKDAIQAFEIIKKENIDLMFLDIQMPEISGLDFLKLISAPPKIVITTAYREYAIEGYELDIIDYLLKPIPFERFLKAINKYYQSVVSNDIPLYQVAPKPKNSFIDIKENKKIRRIFLKDIKYLESMLEYVRIHTDSGKFTTKDSLSNFEDLLPSNSFIRIHKSYIISLDRITSFSATSVELEKIELPISRTYKNEVIKALKSNSPL